MAAAWVGASVKLPRIVVNAKAYPEVTGETRAAALYRACNQAARSTGADIALAPPLGELAALARRDGEVVLLAQHVDPHHMGAATGWVTVEAIQAAGAVGSIVNHAEHKVPHAQVAATIARLDKAKLIPLVCADSLAEVEALARLRPRMLAIEPPALIGGNISVTTADPAIVSDAVRAVRRISPRTKVLCGAGVKNGEDVATALRLGAYGVLLASGVVKARNPGAVLRELASGL
jgi:triosephosphate isomerase